MSDNEDPRGGAAVWAVAMLFVAAIVMVVVFG